MANRIIITDGDWSSDTVQLVPRTALPQVISGMAAGNWYLTNTTTNPEAVTVTAADMSTGILAVSPDATLDMHVSETGGVVTITITSPAEYAGTYGLDAAQLAADLAVGPVWLVNPVLSSEIPVEGGEVVMVPGLAIYDADQPAPVISGALYRGETSLGAVALPYVITAADQGQNLTWRETGGTVTAISNLLAVAAPGDLADTFSAPDGTKLTAYVGESGYGWSGFASGATIENGELKSTGYGAGRLMFRQDVIGADYRITARMKNIPTGSGINSGLALAARITQTATRESGYYALYNGSRWYLSSMTDGSVPNTPYVTSAVPAEADIALEVVGQNIRLFVDGVLTHSIVSADHPTGQPGLYCAGSTTEKSLLNFRVEAI